MIHFNLKHFLKTKKLSLTELSEKTGISRTSLSQLSNGKTQGIQFDTLEKISLALDIDPGKLFEIEIIPPEYLLDSTAYLKKEDGNYIVHLLYKTSIKEENFWFGISIYLNFIEKEKIVVTLNKTRYSLLFYLVNKKYGFYDGSNSEEVPKGIRRGISTAEQNMLSYKPSDFFDNSLKYIQLALNTIPNDSYIDKKSIEIEKAFFSPTLSESEIKRYNIPQEIIKIQSQVYITYIYSLEEIIDNPKVSSIFPKKINVNTNIYEEYIDSFKFI